MRAGHWDLDQNRGTHLPGNAWDLALRVIRGGSYAGRLLTQVYLR